MSEYTRLYDQIGRLVEALEFYADPNVYIVYMNKDPVFGPGHFPTYSEIDRDRGTRARQALTIEAD